MGFLGTPARPLGEGSGAAVGSLRASEETIVLTPNGLCERRGRGRVLKWC